jgi:hypothetical protein
VIEDGSDEDHVEAFWLPYGVLEGSAYFQAANVIDALEVSIWKAVVAFDFAMVRISVHRYSCTLFGI